MDPNDLAAAAAPAAIGGYLARLPQPAHHHGNAIETVREADHAGHHIVIRTTYEVMVDGNPVASPLVVTNAGILHCHALPNYQFKSAVDLVKELIDQFPDDFPPPADGGHGPHHGHGPVHGGS